MSVSNGDERCLLDAADQYRRAGEARPPIHPALAFGRTFLLCAIPSGILVGWVTNQWPAAALPVVFVWWIAVFWPSYRAYYRAKHGWPARPAHGSRAPLAGASTQICGQGVLWCGPGGVLRKLSLDVLRALPGVVVISLIEPQLRVGICCLLPVWCAYTIGRAFVASRRADVVCQENQVRELGSPGVSGYAEACGDDAADRPTLMHGLEQDPDARG